MKPMKLFLTLALIWAAFNLSACDAHAFSKKMPKQEKVEVAPTPAPTVEEPKPVVTPEAPVSLESGEKAKEAIIQAASQSTCATYKFADRGVAPKKYLQGVALVYARQVCQPNKVVANTANGPASKDALTSYGLLGSAKNTYALLIGLGMRESSGGKDCGRDASASNVSADTAEAGTWQTSYNARSASIELPVIYADYKAGKKKCFADVFVKCEGTQNLKNYGTGEGVEFQKLAKSCPAFGAEFAAVTIRTVLGHYGPLKTKKAEYKSQCVDMLTKVEAIVQANPDVCKVL